MSRNDHLSTLVTLITDAAVVDQVLDYAPIVPLSVARQAIVIGTSTALSEATFASYDTQHQLGIWLYIEARPGQEQATEQAIGTAVDTLLPLLREAGYVAGPSAIVPGQAGSLLHKYETAGARWFRVERIPVRHESDTWED